jgi:hypothetical protein
VAARPLCEHLGSVVQDATHLAIGEPMQILVLALCSKGKSLREAIGTDARLERYGLQVTRQLQAGRAPGWLKLHATDATRGALNIEWDAQSFVLSARVITRGSRKPSPIVGDFINYLLDRHWGRVESITTAHR